MRGPPWGMLERLPARAPLTHVAASNGNFSRVKELLLAGALVESKDSCGNTPLLRVCMDDRHGTFQVLTFLVEHAGANVEARNDNGETPLIVACINGILKVVRYLVEEAGANMEAKGKYDQTPLVFASKKGQLDVVRYLVEQAKVETEGHIGNKALILASVEGRLKVVKYLVEQVGANVEAKGDSGNTPLIVASIKGQLEVVKYLVEQAGANVEAKNNYGNTPLMTAVKWYFKGSFSQKKLEVVKYLVQEAGASVKAKNNNGKTALDIAHDEGKTEVVQYLERDDSTVDNDGEENRLFYQSALIAGEARPQQIRLVMSGPWGAGKTSTVRSLQGESFIPEYDSTAGVEIQDHFLGPEVSFSKVYLDWSHRQQDHMDRADTNSELVTGQDPMDIDRMETLHLEDAQTAQIPPLQDRHTSIDPYPNTVLDCGIKSIKFTDEDDWPFSIAIWDFAGQPVYHGMHQAFFRSNCLYLLVLDLRLATAGSSQCTQEQSRTEQAILEEAQKWINSIVSTAGTDIGLVVVGTHADHFVSAKEANVRLEEILTRLGDLVTDIEYDEVLQKAPRLVVDNKSGQGITDLKSTIRSTGQKILDKLPDIPLRWLRLSERLDSLNLQENHFCFKLSNLYPSATAVGISQEELIEALAFLDQIGIIVYTDTEGLKESVFLQPHLLLDAMKSLLIHKSQPEGLRRDQWRTLNTTGILGKEALESLWDAQGFNDQDQLRRILALYGLIIDLQTCVAVPYLMCGGPRAPLEEQEGESEITIQTRFSKHLPPSLFGFLLARMHFIHGIPGQNVDVLCWNSGCLALKSSSNNNTFRVVLSSINLEHGVVMSVRGINEETKKLQDTQTLVDQTICLAGSLHSIVRERYKSLDISSFVTGTKWSTSHEWSLLKTEAGKESSPLCTISWFNGWKYSLKDCISSGSLSTAPAEGLVPTKRQKLSVCSVFVSHTGQNNDASEFAGFLSSKLKDKYCIDVFLDSESLETCDNWCKKIEEHAQGCKVFVVILSESYFERFWCLHELDIALHNGCIIVPVFFWIQCEDSKG